MPPELAELSLRPWRGPGHGPGPAPHLYVRGQYLATTFHQILVGTAQRTPPFALVPASSLLCGHPPQQPQEPVDPSSARSHYLSFRCPNVARDTVGQLAVTGRRPHSQGEWVQALANRQAPGMWPPRLIWGTPVISGPVAAITFDVWHTLIYLSPSDEDRYLDLQLESLAAVLRDSPRSSREGRTETCEPEQAIRQTFLKASQGAGRGRSLEDLAREAAGRAGREPAPERWVDACERLVARQPFQVVPGALGQLERVREGGYRTAVVSNLLGETGRSMWRVLQKLGLDRYLETRAFSDELPWAKPAPEIFWTAIRPLATDPRDAIHIGDLPNDVLGARAAGFRLAARFEGARAYGRLYAALCHPDEPILPPPERVLASWEELPRLLTEIFPEIAPTEGGPEPPAVG